MSAGHHSPLEQFEINYLTHFPHVAGMNLNYSNSALFMTIALGLVIAFMTFSMRGRALIPGRWQSLAELSYEFVAGTLRDNVGSEGRAFFPFIFTLFMFVTTVNLMGMVPYGFTATSHVAVTFALAAFIFLGVTVTGFIRHGVKFLHLFLPDGVPTVMAPLIIFIELFAYLARPVTLSVRLSANMMAGHTMLKVIGGFVFAMGLYGAVPILCLMVLSGFEIFVALLQAYIFTVLTCVYLNDAIHLH